MDNENRHGPNLAEQIGDRRGARRLLIGLRRRSTLVTADELAALMERGEKVVPIDVRDVDEYEAGYVPGAVNIPNVFYYLASTRPEGLEEFHEHFAQLFGDEAGLTGESHQPRA